MPLFVVSDINAVLSQTNDTDVATVASHGSSQCGGHENKCAGFDALLFCIGDDISALLSQTIENG